MTRIAADSSSDIESAIDEFLYAFTHIEWDRFRATFTDDATLFLFPAERSTVEDSFGPLFRTIRERLPPGSSSFELNPEDVDIRTSGDAAIVTFHLRNLGAWPGQLGRRTLVMVQEKDHWRIAHLHASICPDNAQMRCSP